MPRFNIHLAAQPLAIASLLTAIVTVILWQPIDIGLQADLTAFGGSGEGQLDERDMQQVRTQYAVLDRKEDILRYQLKILQQQVDGDPAYVEQLRQSRAALVELLRNKQEAEKQIATYFRQLYESQEWGLAAIDQTAEMKMVPLQWPVEPVYGISAHFHDPEYEDVFGITHEAIDIPVLQGTTVHAPAPGIVQNVVDNGMGYSYVIIRHGSFATLYGHVSMSLVSEGDKVRAGDPIALSGGQPGTPGAGVLTTGPHLHFELIANGKRINPLPYLPKQELEQFESSHSY